MVSRGNQTCQHPMLRLATFRTGKNTCPILKHLAYVTLLRRPSPETIRMQMVGYELPTANAPYAVRIYRKKIEKLKQRRGPRTADTD